MSKAEEKFIEELNKEHEIILGFQEYENKIADLEAKLAEKEEQLLCKTWYKQYKNVMEANEGFYKECAKLREQLAEKDAELNSARVGEQFALKCCNEAKELLAEKEKELEEINREFVQSTHDWKEIVDEKIKTKTEFAIQQLQRVKEFCENSKNQVDYEYYTDCWTTAVDKDSLFIEIDQIIKELEGETK